MHRLLCHIEEKEKQLEKPIILQLNCNLINLYPLQINPTTHTLINYIVQYPVLIVRDLK